MERSGRSVAIPVGKRESRTEVEKAKKSDHVRTLQAMVRIYC